MNLDFFDFPDSVDFSWYKITQAKPNLRTLS
jgi:hypothetical protein